MRAVILNKLIVQKLTVRILMFVLSNTVSLLTMPCCNTKLTSRWASSPSRPRHWQPVYAENQQPLPALQM